MELEKKSEMLRLNHSNNHNHYFTKKITMTQKCLPHENIMIKLRVQYQACGQGGGRPLGSEAHPNPDNILKFRKISTWNLLVNNMHLHNSSM